MHTRSMKNSKKQDLNRPAIISAMESQYQGIGYFIPSNTDASQVRELYAEWNEKLQKSGLVDIEHHSAMLTGQVSSRLKGRHNSDLHNAPSLFNYQLADTYLTNYFDHNRPSTKRLQSMWLSDRTLLAIWTAGVNLGETERLFANPTKTTVKHFKTKHGLEHISDYALMQLKGRSKFWVYHRTRTALAYCYAWHASDVNGELDETALNIYRLHGIDSREAEGIINRARLAAGLEPVKLKWEKKSY